jgi:hypothetical protein
MLAAATAVIHQSRVANTTLAIVTSADVTPMDAPGSDGPYGLRLRLASDAPNGAAARGALRRERTTPTGPGHQQRTFAPGTPFDRDDAESAATREDSVGRAFDEPLAAAVGRLRARRRWPFLPGCSDTPDLIGDHHDLRVTLRFSRRHRTPDSLWRQARRNIGAGAAALLVAVGAGIAAAIAAGIIIRVSGVRVPPPAAKSSAHSSRITAVVFLRWLTDPKVTCRPLVRRKSSRRLAGRARGGQVRTLWCGPRISNRVRYRRSKHPATGDILHTNYLLFGRPTQRPKQYISNAAINAHLIHTSYRKFCHPGPACPDRTKLSRQKPCASFEITQHGSRNVLMEFV